MSILVKALFCLKLASIAGLSKDPKPNTDSEVQSAENYTHANAIDI